MTNKSMLNDFVTTVSISADGAKGVKKAARSARKMAVTILSGVSALVGLSVSPMAHAYTSEDPNATAVLGSASCPNGQSCIFTFKNSDGTWPAIALVYSVATAPGDVVAKFSMVNGVPTYTVLPNQCKSFPNASYPAADCGQSLTCVSALGR